MNNHADIIKWATDYLHSKGYTLQSQPEIVLETPWSSVIRFASSQGNLYLKETPPDLSMEADITRLLAEKFKANVPHIITTNNELHCFLMRDAGFNLRKYLKTDFKIELLIRTIQEYTTIQRSTENNVDDFIALNVPDWRLEQIPKLYENMVNDEVFLKADDITDKELQNLQALHPKVLAHCNALAQYGIPETIVQYDFNTNNVLYDLNTQKMTSIDLGEIVISHPFFSLYNFLIQARKHESIKENDAHYLLLHDAFFENWLSLTPKNRLIETFILVKKLFPLYSAFAFYRLMHCVDPDAIKSFYANQPNRFAGFLREYMTVLND